MPQNYLLFTNANTPLVGVFAVGRQKNAPKNGKLEKSFSVTDEKLYLCNKIIGYGRKITDAQEVQPVGFRPVRLRVRAKRIYGQNSVLHGQPPRQGARWTEARGQELPAAPSGTAARGGRREGGKHAHHQPRTGGLRFPLHP